VFETRLRKVKRETETAFNEEERRTIRERDKEGTGRREVPKRCGSPT
jgi:hypothetical protein